MHLLLMTRGIDRQVQELKSLMEGQRFAWKRANLNFCVCGAHRDIHGTDKSKCPKFTPKEEVTEVQGALRPIQIFEYVFPRESLNDVLGGLSISGPIKRPEIKSLAWMMRKMLGYEQIPDKKELAVTGYVPPGTVNGQPMKTIPVHKFLAGGVAVYPIGIRDDPQQDAAWPDGTFYNQEML